MTLTDHEEAFWAATVRALRAFRSPRHDELRLERIRAAMREADRQHTPEEIAAAERALSIA